MHFVDPGRDYAQEVPNYLSLRKFLARREMHCAAPSSSSGKFTSQMSATAAMILIRSSPASPRFASTRIPCRSQARRAVTDDEVIESSSAIQVQGRNWRLWFRTFLNVVNLLLCQNDAPCSRRRNCRRRHLQHRGDRRAKREYGSGSDPDDCVPGAGLSSRHIRGQCLHHQHPGWRTFTFSLSSPDHPHQALRKSPPILMTSPLLSTTTTTSTTVQVALCAIRDARSAHCCLFSRTSFNSLTTQPARL